MQVWCNLLFIAHSDALSELKSKESYAAYILEKYISLLQFTKYIMLRSLLKYVWKGFETVLRHYVIFKTLNFMHMNSPGSFHPTSDVYEWLTVKLYFRFVPYETDSVRYSCWKRCFTKQVKLSEWHILWFLFIHN